mgnify:CR=1 FL=1
MPLNPQNRRPKMYRLLLAVIIFACLTLPPLLGMAQESKVAKLNHKGLKDMLLASKGKVVVLDFWASY